MATWLKGHHVRKHGHDPELAKKNEYLFRTYGLSREEFDALVASQDGKCAICGTTAPGHGRAGKPRAWCVDHDHDTGAVRGLLCAPCNAGIGNLRDDPALLDRAAAYLRRKRPCASGS